MGINEYVLIGWVCVMLVWYGIALTVDTVRSNRWHKRRDRLDRIEELEHDLLPDADEHPWGDGWPKMPDWVKEQRKR